ncbi:MAG TPA: DUF4350 domain-containing protein [Candidatus Acidoferrum sp.]|jgi:hypothetical protein
MPIRIAASDRKLLFIGGGLMLVMLITLAILTPPQEQGNSPVPSTYSAQSGGAEAAYRLLTRLHYPVRRWENPPTELDGKAGNILLILAGPVQPPSSKERKALSDFVEQGGHVLFTSGTNKDYGNIKDYFPDAQVAPERPDPQFAIFNPMAPSRITRDAQKVSLQPSAYWGKLKAEQLSLYGADNSAAVVSWQKGQGKILWWAGSTPLTNAGITREDNLRFFLNSVGNWTDKGNYQIYWDEYFHGQRSSLWSYVGKTSLAWSALQVGLLALAVVFTFSRRSGPTFIPAENSRLWPLEFVDTLGGLYERAGAASSAVSVSYLRLRTLLTRQLSLPSSTRDAELAVAAEQRLDWKESGLGELLRRAAAARREEKFRSGDALKIVQELEKFAEKLSVRAQIHRGKS